MRRWIIGGALMGAAGYGVSRLYESYQDASESRLSLPRDRVLSLVTQERPIDYGDSERLQRGLERLEGPGPHVLVLHTLGGLWGASMQIAEAIRRKGGVFAVVPHWAQSGGTLIALACERIVMPPFATLGPVDPQIGGYPSRALQDLLAAKSVNEIDDHTWLMAHQAAQALEVARSYVTELAPEAVERLVGGSIPHSTPISREEAIAIGLPIESIESISALQAFTERLSVSE